MNGCSNDWYFKESVEGIVQKLGTPIFRHRHLYTIITYWEHTINEDHIIDIEVEGLYDDFDITIDG